MTTEILNEAWDLSHNIKETNRAIEKINAVDNYIDLISVLYNMHLDDLIPDLKPLKESVLKILEEKKEVAVNKFEAL